MDGIDLAREVKLRWPRTLIGKTIVVIVEQFNAMP